MLSLDHHATCMNAWCTPKGGVHLAFTQYWRFHRKKLADKITGEPGINCPILSVDCGANHPPPFAPHFNYQIYGVTKEKPLFLWKTGGNR